jgi:protein-S-isoprenylcysteine O-methyltransferase Ste14
VNTTDHEKSTRFSRFKFPRWLGAIVCGVGIPVVHGVVPWALSWLGVRHGWVDGRPGPWNFAGLALVALGSAIIGWAMALHFIEAPRGWEFERAPKYLLTHGPYRFSRNPIYVAYSVLWPSWMIFYGSVALVVICALIWPGAYFLVIPREERNLEARFGEAYREYKRTVPRWLGRIRR